jgi:hypothetical protein
MSHAAALGSTPGAASDSNREQFEAVSKAAASGAWVRAVGFQP